MEIASTVLGLTFITRTFLESLTVASERRLFEIWECFWFLNSVAEFELEQFFGCDISMNVIVAYIRIHQK